MKTSATLVLAASALASAQVTYNSTTNEYVCSRPNSAFCAGDSFGTSIIIRCDANGRGQPGSCTNNLAGQFPVGVQPALCWQSQPQAGDAACEKNCVVYADRPFRLPAAVCTPYATPSGTAAPTTTYPFGPFPSANNGTSSRTTALSSTARFPSSSRVTSAPRSTGTGTGGTGGGPVPSGNSTTPTSSRGGGSNSTAPTSSRGGGGGGGSGSASGTRTPIPPSGSATGGPTTGPTTVPTAGAAQNAVGSLAIAGLVAAFFI